MSKDVTVSDQYRSVLRATHQQRPPTKPWGTTGARNAGDQVITTLRGRGDVKTVLDFGAGQRKLGAHVLKELPYLQWTDYDPGIPGIDELPEGKFDFIVSSDCLEHVEPEKLDGVLDWMCEHARRGMFHHIACDPCGLTLPDGRNAHLIVQPPAWWRAKFEVDGWTLMYYADCVVRKRSAFKRHAIVQVDKT